MRNILTLNVIGTLYKPAQLRSGTRNYVSFSLPVETGYGDKKETVWCNVSWFGTFAEKKYSKMIKGTEVVVSGNLTGTKEGSLFINASSVEIRKYGEQESFNDEIGDLFHEDDEMPDLF